MVGETSQVSINKNIKKLSTSKMMDKKIIPQNLVVIDKTILENLMTNNYTKVSKNLKQRLFDMHTTPLKNIMVEKDKEIEDLKEFIEEIQFRNKINDE